MGGGHSRDLWWPAELWANDRETWGKTIARSRGLARRKESPNGGANQRLAGVERQVVSHLGIGERNGKRMKLRPMSPFYRGRREKEQASVVGDSRSTACRSGGDARAPDVSGSPIPVPLMGGPGTSFKPFLVGVAHWALLFIGSSPLTIDFLFF
jgi:hypothetical protein